MKLGGALRVSGKWKVGLWILGLLVLFTVYCSGLSQNPPGFYVDESAEAYNAYLISRTGRGEFGDLFPLFFQTFTGTFIQYVNPVQIYLLAIVFRVLPPSILTARVFSALGVFAACVLLGLLARKISGRISIGLIVGGTALLTPWLFEARGLLLEPQFIPLALMPLLFSLYAAGAKERWNWSIVLRIAGSLALLTYTYTSGRVLGLLLAAGLLSFAISRGRLLDVAKTWLVYAISLIPIVYFNSLHPDLMAKRLTEVSYMKPGIAWSVVLPQFFRRYMEDQSLTPLLWVGDYHARHHVPESGGPILFATFLIGMAGLLIVLAHRFRDAWWRFVAFGLAAAVVPGAITIEPFHQMRLMAYPVFLLLLSIPALEWLIGRSTDLNADVPDQASRIVSCSRRARFAAVGCLVVATLVQAYSFQTSFRADGPKREHDFDAFYKGAYDAAVARPERPIYLEDGMWGPTYVHSYWYAAIEGRPTSEFVHLAQGAKAPPGSLVLSSADSCTGCENLGRYGVFLLYTVR